MNNEQKVNKVKKLLFITTWKTNNTNRDNIRFQLKSNTYTIRYVKISLHNNISTREHNINYHRNSIKRPGKINKEQNVKIVKKNCSL